MVLSSCDYFNSFTLTLKRDLIRLLESHLKTCHVLVPLSDYVRGCVTPPRPSWVEVTSGRETKSYRKENKKCGSAYYYKKLVANENFPQGQILRRFTFYSKNERLFYKLNLNYSLPKHIRKMIKIFYSSSQRIFLSFAFSSAFKNCDNFKHL